VRQSKLRSDAEAVLGQGGTLMEKQISLTREAQQRKCTVEPLAAPPSDSPSTVMALIERAALDPSAGVEKLDRMMAMYERLKAR